MHIAVIDDYQGAFRTVAGFPKLNDHTVTVYTDTEKDPVRLAERLKDAEAVVLTQQRSRFPRALVERLPKLKVIFQTGRNVAHVDVDACAERGIVICGAGGGGPAPTAELTWGLILAAIRHIPFEVERLKQGHWQSTTGTLLEKKTLGIYAFGNIGSRVAAVGKAFGMKVQCWGRAGSLERAAKAGYDAAASREAFFESSDVISLHLPLNAETRGIVTAADLARMKPSALMVNTSRAPIIAAGALESALKAGRPGRAAVDVYEDEPVIGADHPLLKMPNVIGTPHLGYVVRETYEALYNAVIEGIVAYAQGAPVNVLNKKA